MKSNRNGLSRSPASDLAMVAAPTDLCRQPGQWERIKLREISGIVERLRVRLQDSRMKPRRGSSSKSTCRAGTLPPARPFGRLFLKNNCALSSDKFSHNQGGTQLVRNCRQLDCCERSYPWRNL